MTTTTQNLTAIEALSRIAQDPARYRSVTALTELIDQASIVVTGQSR